MTLAEASRLAVCLRDDPSSHTAAALQDWQHPISREALILADLFDITLGVAGVKDAAPHASRPWDARTVRTERMGNAGGRSFAEVADILARLRRGDDDTDQTPDGGTP